MSNKGNNESIILDKAIIETLRKNDKELRAQLCRAKAINIHVNFKLPSFQGYLARVAKLTEYSVKHLHRIAKEGEMEIRLTGGANIGLIPGAVLRVLFENVLSDRAEDVYKKAIEIKDAEKKYPTSKNVRKAAEELKAFKSGTKTKPEIVTDVVEEDDPINAEDAVEELDKADCTKLSKILELLLDAEDVDTVYSWLRDIIEQMEPDEIEDFLDELKDEIAKQKKK